MRLAMCAFVLCVGAFALAGCGGDDDSSGGAGGLNVDRFDSDAAWRLVERQVEVGQRPAGSPQLRRLAEELRPLLPGGRFEPVPGEPGLRNVVGTLPGRRPGIVVGAHYDTLVKPKGFVGANNGAAGTAVVIEAARAVAAAERKLADPEGGAREVRFVLFDGEEPAAGLPEESADFYHSGLRGSRAYVAAHPDRTARDGAPRLRRQQGPEAPARGQLAHRALVPASRPRRAGSARSTSSRRTPPTRSPTTTRPSSAPGSRRST